MINKIRAEIQFTKGQNQAKQCLLNESIKSFNVALSFNPSYSGIYLHKALSQSRLNDFDGAHQTLRTAIEMNPKNPAYNLFMGIIYFDHGNYNEAITAFEDTLKISPDNHLALCYKSLILLIQGNNLDEAGDILRRYIKYTNHDFQSKFLVFCETICFQNRKKEKSFDILRDLNSDMTENLTINIVDAISLALKPFIYDVFHFSNTDKKSAYKHYNKAVKAQLNGQFDEAINEYGKALKINAEFYDATDKIIEIYWSRQSYHSFMIYINKLPVYQKMTSLISNYKVAEKEEINIARDLMQYSSLLFMLAYANYQVGNYDGALEMFAFLSKYDIPHPLVFYYLALCYISKKNLTEARRLFQLSLERLEQKVLINRLEESLNSIGH